MRVPAKAQPWPASRMHRAGVSSFGFGGTIAHVVLEDRCHEDRRDQEVKAPVAEQEDQNMQILAFSAASPKALQALAGAYRDYLTDTGNRFSLKDICFTAAVRRSHHHQRLAVVGNSHSTVAKALADLLGDERLLSRAKRARTAQEPQKIFVFPGQGGQWLGMGRRLLQQSRVFRQTIGACEECMRAHVPWSLIDMITNEKGGALPSVDIIQPMIFAIQVGLAEVWKSWGIHPDVIVGQSMGEIAAAYVAGALSLEDAAHVVCLRSRLLTKISNTGAMAIAAVSSPEAEQILNDTRLAGAVFIAVSSSPASTVLSGSREAIADLIAHLERRAVFCRRIDVDYASHCPGVEPIREELVEGLSKLISRPSSVPMYSTVTTRPVTADQLNAAYWWKNLRAPVRFAETISQILEKRPDVFLEISPHPLLETAIRESLTDRSAQAEFLPSMQRNTDELTTLLGSLGTFYTHGAAVRWPQVYPEGRFVSVPAYPFDRKSFWIERPAGEMKADAMQEHNTSAIFSRGENESSAMQSTLPARIVAPAKQVLVAGKKDLVLERLRQLVARLLQLAPEDIEFTAPFLEMGADSMVLARVLKAIADEFEVNLSLKQLFEQFTTLNALGDFICATGHFEPEREEPHRNLPDSPQQGSSEAGLAAQFMPVASGKTNSLAELTSTELERIFSSQLSAMSSVVAGQLETLRGRSAPAHRELHQTQTERGAARATLAPATVADIKATQKGIQPPTKKDVFVAYSPIQPGAAKPLPEKQQRYLDHLIRSYTSKTPKSKQLPRIIVACWQITEPLQVSGTQSRRCYIRSMPAGLLVRISGTWMAIDMWT
ncbi:MAG TPA: acyltransferase domain-containing protein [Alphaproteobacteria bacterium]|nr:acyltransferase domain-containing protein [Alphaproteobacteria bacterium]